MLSPQPYLFPLFPSLGLLKYHWYYVKRGREGGKEGSSELRKEEKKEGRKEGRKERREGKGDFHFMMRN